MLFWEKWLNFLKEKTDEGVLFKVRCYLLYVLLYLVNFDTYLYFLFRKIRKPLTKKETAILSLYRPIFWHGNIFEAQIYKKIEKNKHPVHILCHGFLDVCDTHYYKANKENHPTVCQDCRLRNKLFHAKNNLDTIVLDDYMRVNQIQTILHDIDAIITIEQAKNYTYAGLPLGKLVHLSVCRYWLRLSLNEKHLPVYKDFLRSAVKLYNAFSHLLDEFNIENFLVFNGRYTTYGIPLQLIMQKQKKYATYELSEQERFLFSANDISTTWLDVKPKFEQWIKNPGLTSQDLAQKVADFVQQRKKLFVSSYVNLNNAIDISHVDVAVFTNIVWDCSVFDCETIFDSQFQWLSEIISWAKNHQDKHVVIRIHPAETNVTYNKTLEMMQSYIAEHHADLTSNVTIIPPYIRENSYRLVEKAKVVCVYNSTIGLEAALLGKCVITGAMTHYTTVDGITLNPKTKEEHFLWLNQQLNTQESFKPDHQQVLFYTYWFYKIFHRLNNTHLYKKPFVLMEDSRFLRIPKIDAARGNTTEFDEIVNELIS